MQEIPPKQLLFDFIQLAMEVCDGLDFDSNLLTDLQF